MKRRTPPVFALWLGWALTGLALLGFGLSALSGRIWSLLTLRHNQAVAASSELASSFQALEHLPHVMVGAARDAADTEGLDAARLAGLRAEGEPFCSLYWLGPSGQPKIKGDSTPPQWLWRLVERRVAGPSRTLFLLRPLPPGLEAGQLSARQAMLDDETPDRYLAVAVRTNAADVVLAQLDLDNVFGPWLKKRIERTPLAESLQATLGERGTLEETPAQPSGPDLWPSARNIRWSWVCPTFFTSTSHPFPPLILQLDNEAALTELRWEMAGAAALACLMMSAFALAIVATQRAVRKEIQYAQARTRFTEMVSHELRTPLTAIAMYGEILREGLIDDPRKLASYHALLATETERLKRLVENVLTFGRLQGEAVPINWQPVSLPQVAESAARPLLSLGSDIRFGSFPEGTILSDSAVLQQILLNLLENATKHGGGQPIEVSGRKEGAGIVLEVSDRGPGVPECFREEIFEPYTRVQAADGAKKAGVGLGLTVVENLTRCLGGRAEYRPRPGGGAIFSVILPKKEGD